MKKNLESRTRLPVSELLSEEQKALLITRTDDLIKEILNNDVQMLVFKDKSARPLSWMLLERWKTRFPGKKMPAIKFVNIGGEKMSLANEYLYNPDWYRKYTPKEEQEVALRRYFEELDSSDYIKKTAGDIERTKGKVMLVDDYSFSGFSLFLATKFFQYHYPSLNNGQKLVSYTFFHDEDGKIFPPYGDFELLKQGLKGFNDPWNLDSTLTLLAEDKSDGDAAMTAEPERNPEKRKRGLEMREEIRKIFSGEK